jgi:hypothetical protein
MKYARAMIKIRNPITTIGLVPPHQENYLRRYVMTTLPLGISFIETEFFVNANHCIRNVIKRDS